VTVENSLLRALILVFYCFKFPWESDYSRDIEETSYTFTMVVGAGASGHAALSQKRLQFAGPSGVKGLLQNKRIFAIAVFASLGGFVYGCESTLHRHQKKKKKKTDGMNSRRQSRHVWSDSGYAGFFADRTPQLDHQSDLQRLLDCVCPGFL